MILSRPILRSSALGAVAGARRLHRSRQRALHTRAKGCNVSPSSEISAEQMRISGGPNIRVALSRQLPMDPILQDYHPIADYPHTTSFAKDLGELGS